MEADDTTGPGEGRPPTPDDSPTPWTSETKMVQDESDDVERCCSSCGPPLCPVTTPSSHFRGIKRDIIRRKTHYLSDWTDGHTAKTTASIFFMFFTSVAPAITFAGLLESETDSIGVVEVLVSSAISGVIFSLFAGQPLVIVGVTGPVSILTISIYGMSKSLGIKFVPFYAWTQIFAALMHFIIAAAGLCDYIKYITNFSCHTFGLLIALIYLVTGATSIVQYFTRDQEYATALAEFVIALGTTLCSLYLSKANDWVILNKFSRGLIADYAPTFSILFWTVISLVGRNTGRGIPRLDVPNTFKTLNGRAWFASNLFKIPAWAIILAIVPATIVTVLFVFDHNVSSIMAQSREFRLQKGSAYHLDFFVLGGCVLATGLLGVPPCNGLIPQAPLHTKSLCKFKKTVQNGVQVDVVDSTFEVRYTNFAQALLTGVVCFKPFLGVLGKIPNACLHGLFVFMALSSLAGNELWDRFVLLISEPGLRVSRHDFFKKVDFKIITRFTKLQLVSVVVVFLVTLTPLAMAFPLFIAALVYVRTKLLPKYFKTDDLLALDPLIDLHSDGDSRFDVIPEKKSSNSRDCDDDDPVVDVEHSQETATRRVVSSSSNAVDARQTDDDDDDDDDVEAAQTRGDDSNTDAATKEKQRPDDATVDAPNGSETSV